MATTGGMKPTQDAVDTMREKVMDFIAGRIPADDMAQLEEIVAIEMAAVTTALETEADDKGWGADSRRGFNIAGARNMTPGEMRELRQAEQDCRPILGDDMVAFDSGDGIYRAALRKLGHDVTGLPRGGSGVVFKQAKASGILYRDRPRMAADSAPARAASASFDKLFPGAVKLVKG